MPSDLVQPAAVFGVGLNLSLASEGQSMTIEPAILIAALSALVAAISTVLTAWNYRREQLNQKVSAAKWKREYFADLLKWSDECMALLSEAFHLCELDLKRMEDGRLFDARHNLRVRLSAQIDRGRWFFPNYAIEQHGQHKHEAYRGFRPAVLDGLVNAYRAITELNFVDASRNQDIRMQVEAAKRMFTSEIQKVLDPRSRDEEFRKLLGKVADA